MAKKIKIDELIEAFTYMRMITAITTALLPAMRQLLQEQLTDLTSSVKTLEAEQAEHSKEIVELKAENLVLRNRLETIDTESRLSSLIIHGIPEVTYAERTTSTSASAGMGAIHSAAAQSSILDLCVNKLGLHLTETDIESSFRIRSAKPGVPRPVIVTFSTRKMRNRVMEKRRELKRQGDRMIYIGENLTKKASELFFEARNMCKAKRLNSCWTRDGKVYVKRLDTDKPSYVADSVALGKATAPP